MVQTDSHSGDPDSARSMYGFADIAVLFRTGRQVEEVGRARTERDQQLSLF
jgi:hypothetical protein